MDRVAFTCCINFVKQDDLDEICIVYIPNGENCIFNTVHSLAPGSAIKSLDVESLSRIVDSLLNFYIKYDGYRYMSIAVKTEKEKEFLWKFGLPAVVMNRFLRDCCDTVSRTNVVTFPNIDNHNVNYHLWGTEDECCLTKAFSFRDTILTIQREEMKKMSFRSKMY
ncbi:hypothetical protein HNY73_012831 [Argiope bruennichi]|uniref:Uncharacterized protein n=1 Tax=Argiope bruennichi TaxID=94029 RepID=A0A8T0EY02_ARGBR|nr:hypothetical protein HNY73_012831 [Argiope bruennichi]